MADFLCNEALSSLAHRVPGMTTWTIKYNGKENSLYYKVLSRTYVQVWRQLRAGYG